MGFGFQIGHLQQHNSRKLKLNLLFQVLFVRILFFFKNIIKLQVYHVVVEQAREREEVFYTRRVAYIIVPIDPRHHRPNGPTLFIQVPRVNFLIFVPSSHVNVLWSFSNICHLCLYVLRRVHLIIVRLDDTYCDPYEFITLRFFQAFAPLQACIFVPLLRSY